MWGDSTGLLTRVRNRLGRGERGEVQSVGGVQVWSSPRGRSFPWKAWDHEYFKRMCETRCAMCPNGDYVWTYRFFEAVMCGCLPIVQEPCEAYEGFHFGTFEENPESIAWDESLAAGNVARLLETVVVPIADLEEELDRLWEQTSVTSVGR